MIEIILLMSIIFAVVMAIHLWSVNELEEPLRGFNIDRELWSKILLSFFQSLIN